MSRSIYDSKKISFYLEYRDELEDLLTLDEFLWLSSSDLYILIQRGLFSRSFEYELFLLFDRDIRRDARKHVEEIKKREESIKYNITTIEVFNNSKVYISTTESELAENITSFIEFYKNSWKIEVIWNVLRITWNIPNFHCQLQFYIQPETVYTFILGKSTAVFKNIKSSNKSSIYIKSNNSNITIDSLDIFWDFRVSVIDSSFNCGFLSCDVFFLNSETSTATISNGDIRYTNVLLEESICQFMKGYYSEEYSLSLMNSSSLYLSNYANIVDSDYDETSYSIKENE